MNREQNTRILGLGNFSFPSPSIPIPSILINERIARIERHNTHLHLPHTFMDNNSAGNSVMTALIILVIIAVVAALAYFAYAALDTTDADTGVDVVDDNGIEGTMDVDLPDGDTPMNTPTY